MNQLRECLSSSEIDPSRINAALDALITEVHSKTPFPSITGDWIQVIQTFCSKVDTRSPLLLGKCASFLSVLIGTQRKPLSPEDIDFLVSWACRCLNQAPDITYTDFLQMLNALMKKEPNYFATERTDLIDVLTSKLEDRVTVALAEDVIDWRLTCLRTISTCAPASSYESIAVSYVNLVFDLKSDVDRHFCCRVWINVLDGLEQLCSHPSDWIQPLTQNIVAAVHSAMAFGLNVPPSPSMQFPAHMTTMPSLSQPAVKSVLKLKRKNKNKVKQVPWNQDGKDRQSSFNVESTPWVSSSDSELSDSESDSEKRTKRTEAHVRHSAYNLFFRLVKTIGVKPLFEWYCALFSRLTDGVRAETYSKARCALLNAVTTFLCGSKLFLAQAQQNDSKSFTSFSEVLASLLSSMHSAILFSLKNVPLSDKQQLTALFLAVGALMKVTPYPRLQPDLFPTLYAAIEPFTALNDLYIVSCVLQCLVEVSILPYDLDAFMETGKVIAESKEPWIVKYALSYVDEEVNGIRVFAWSVIEGLIQYHFKIIQPRALYIESKILQDLASEKQKVAPLKSLARLLDNYMNDTDSVLHAHSLWDQLLETNSPFLRLIQETDKPAGVACQCLSLMGSKKFHMLPEEKKILVITLTFGCCCAELTPVRYAALETLGSFLSYAQMSGEVQFICDAKDYLIRAIKDPIESVRLKATWAISNLADLLVASKDDDILSEVGLYDLVEAALTLSSDTYRVKQNIIRALGHLFLLASADDLQQARWKTALDRGCTMLLRCATSGSVVKIQWNACYAIATMLSNESLYESLALRAPDLLHHLCKILVSCNNFKVRMNACLALSSIKRRDFYGQSFFLVWQSLLEGLDNAANMPDFSEFKHQSGLKDNLCLAVCHMTCFLRPADLGELKEILQSRLDFLADHLKQCQERMTPEQAGELLRATQHVESLAKQEGCHFANVLYIAFQVAQLATRSYPRTCFHLPDRGVLEIEVVSTQIGSVLKEALVSPFKDSRTCDSFGWMQNRISSTNN
ncbi:unnamed protein product [Nesidiocoris tenuis]|uniref:HEAT repeat-containing protein 6 n=1 Tax=Nesidiocoris tenuis TaxID=355587 RepID=A0A6H5GGB0_9HEMI|nr:unnamed protein product [Nesidiocoris tenuis]